MSAALLPPRPLCLAAAAYPAERHASWDTLTAKLDAWLAEAARAGADIAVLPEYAGLEAATPGAPAVLSPPEWCARAADVAERYAQLCAVAAATHRLTLLAGSLPAQSGAGLVNRASLCLPDGRVVPQDKQVLTPWERAHTPLVSGPAFAALDTSEGRIGTLICYDGEFPPLARALGADILLVPSCTEAPAGDARVRAGARARALEGQCIAVHAPLLGGIAGCDIADLNTGAAGIYAPPDTPFPEDGVLARGAADAPGWVLATVPAGALSRTRAQGAVANRADMAHAETRARHAAAQRG